MTTFTDQEQSIEDQAAFWLVRLDALDCTPEDRFAFEAWKQQDPAHERMLLRLQKGNALVDRYMIDSRIAAMLEEARAEQRAGERSLAAALRTAGGLAALAASIVVAVFVAVPSLQMPGDIEVLASSDVEVFETSVGERSMITLADSSVVSINTKSRPQPRSVSSSYCADRPISRLPKTSTARLSSRPATSASSRSEPRSMFVSIGRT